MASTLTVKVATTVALILSIYGNFKYAIGRSPVDDDPEHDPFFRVGYTPFTGNILTLFVFWGLLHIHQIVFVSKYQFTDSGIALRDVSDGSSSSYSSNKIAWHFTLFNFLHFFWVLLFSNGHYIWSEIFIILNFLQICFFYVGAKTYKTSSIADYMFIHAPVTALPLSWLLYALFWNGAVMVGSHNLAARIVANIFIWNFLFVPMFYIVVFRDWAVGAGSGILTLSLALGQFFTKIFSLQWIFASVISAMLWLSTIAVFSTNMKNKTADGESAPLIS